MLGLLVVGGVTAIFWPSGDEEPRARQYRDVVACLLTDDKGLNSPAAASVWAGMQDASLATLARVQYLEVDGAQTAKNAETFLASLAHGKCVLVLAVGEAPIGALTDGAERFPQTKFVAVGTGKSASNVSVLEVSDDSVRIEVKKLVTAAVS